MDKAECHVGGLTKSEVNWARTGGEGAHRGERPSSNCLWLRARGLRLRQRLAREHFVAVGCHIDERSDNDGHLLHVRLLDTFVNVHVGVMGASGVVQWILNELKTWQADAVEGKVIGAACVSDGESIHAEIMEWDHPGGKNGSDHFVALQINATDFARAIVYVVVGIEFGVLGKSLNKFCGRVGSLAIPEVLFHIGTRAEQALFFARPETDTNGAAHFEPGGLEDADGFEHYS